MSTTLLDQIVEPVVDCLTTESARRIIELKADDATQARVDALAEKANQGTLSEDERVEYDRILAAFHLVTILQARARRLIKA